MAGLPELLNFVTKFSNLWKSNKSARLAAECHGGKATVSLHLQLGVLTPEKVLQPSPPRPSPSRLRRRARRAQERAKAAANAASTDDTAVEAAQVTDTAVQTVDETILVEAAVQTVCTTKEVAVQAVLPQKPVQPEEGNEIVFSLVKTNNLEYTCNFFYFTFLSFPVSLSVSVDGAVSPVL